MCVKYTWKPLVCLYLENQTLVFLGNLILFVTSMSIARCCITSDVSGFWEAWRTNPEIRLKLLPWIRCYNMRFWVLFELKTWYLCLIKVMINIFQLSLTALSTDPERSYELSKVDHHFHQIGCDPCTNFGACPFHCMTFWLNSDVHSFNLCRIVIINF